MVTIVPGAPLDGDRLERLGAEGSGTRKEISAEYELMNPIVSYACNAK
jgi:hypothetical protein